MGSRGLEIEQRTSPEGHIADGATLIGVEDVHSTGRRDVAGVNVSIRKGYRELDGRTYPSVWDGDAWVDTSPDAVNITAT